MYLAHRIADTLHLVLTLLSHHNAASLTEREAVEAEHQD